MLTNAQNQIRLAEYQRPSQLHMPDYLTVGKGSNCVGNNCAHHGTGAQTPSENRAQFYLWVILAAPLIHGNDIRHMDNFTTEMVTSAEVLAVNQDPHCIQGSMVRAAGSCETWIKPLSDGTFAVLLLNKGTTASNATVYFNNGGELWGSGVDFFPAIFDEMLVRDLSSGTDLGVHSSTFTAVVPSHDALLLKMLPPSSIKSNCTNFTRFLQGNQCDDKSIIGAGSMRRTTEECFAWCQESAGLCRFFSFSGNDTSADAERASAQFASGGTPWCVRYTTCVPRKVHATNYDSFKLTCTSNSTRVVPPLKVDDTAVEMPDTQRQPPEFTTQLFMHGEGPCTCIGIPVMLREADGVLLAFAQCRVGLAWAKTDGCFVEKPAQGNSSACHGTCIVLKRSVDGGRTFSPLSVVADPAFSLMPVVDMVRKRVVMVFNGGDDVPNPPYIQSTSKLFVTLSTLGPTVLSKQSWSKPRQIAKFPDGWANVPGPNAGVQLPAGSSHAGRLVFAGWLNNTGETCQIVVWHTDDGGDSFVPARNPQSGLSAINGSCEAGLGLLPGGGLLLIGNDGASYDRGPCKGDTLLHSISNTGGELWSPPICDEALVSAGCQASVLSLGKRLLVSNPEGAYFSPPLPQSRSGMTVHISDDVAGSWQRLNLSFDSGGVNGSSAGYSSLVALTGGRVGLAWETSGPGATCYGERCRIVFTTFTLDSPPRPSLSLPPNSSQTRESEP